MPVMLAPAGSDPATRISALERELRRVASLADGALQIPPSMRGGTPGTLVAAGQSVLDLGGLSQVMNVLVNGGTQTVGPIAGVAGPPLGLSGAGGEVVLTTASFTLPRQQTVMLLAICSNYVLCTVAFSTSHPVYFQVDGTDSLTAYASTPVWASPGNAETRSLSATIVLVTTLAAGAHTVKVMWNSEEGASDTIHNANNPLFVFQLGGQSAP